MRGPLKAFPRTFTALSRQSAFGWLPHVGCQCLAREAEKTNRKKFLTAIVIQRGICSCFCAPCPQQLKEVGLEKTVAQGQEEYRYTNFPSAPTSSLPLAVYVCPHAWS